MRFTSHTPPAANSSLPQSSDQGCNALQLPRPLGAPFQYQRPRLEFSLCSHRTRVLSQELKPGPSAHPTATTVWAAKSCAKTPMCLRLLCPLLSGGSSSTSSSHPRGHSALKQGWGFVQPHCSLTLHQVLGPASPHPPQPPRRETCTQTGFTT